MTRNFILYGDTRFYRFERFELEDVREDEILSKKFLHHFSIQWTLTELLTKTRLSSALYTLLVYYISVNNSLNTAPAKKYCKGTFCSEFHS